MHSERTDLQMRKQGQRLNGLQLWFALPEAAEETDPMFEQLGIYVVSGCIDIRDQQVPEHRTVVFVPGKEVSLRARRDSRIALIGGRPSGRRHMW